MNILCRCLNCCAGDTHAECDRRATAEDGLCDTCRTLGPSALSGEVRAATGFDAEGYATGWKVLAR